MCREETYRACRRTSSPCAGEVTPGSEEVLVWRGGLVRDGGVVRVMKTKACSLGGGVYGINSGVEECVGMEMMRGRHTAGRTRII